MGRELLAHAKPSEHKVYSVIDKDGNIGRGNVYSFCRVRRKELTEHQCIMKLMKQVGRVTLRRVKIMFNMEKPEKW